MNTSKSLLKTFRIIVGITSILVLPALTASAADYYVSASDANASDDYTAPTSALPWKTLAKVNATKFSPGDNIYLKCGDTWRETLTISSSGTSTGRITFTSYGSGAKPVISGADVVTGWTQYADGTANTYLATLTGTTCMVTADSAYLKKGTSATTLTANQYYWSGGVLYVNIGADPAAHVIEAGQRSFPIYCNSAKPNYYNYLTFDNLRIEKSNLSNIRLYKAANITIQNCELYFGNSNGTYGGGGVCADSCNDLLFTGNSVNYALGDGVMVWRSLRTEVSNSVFDNILDDGGNAGADGIQIGAPSSTRNACDGFKILNNTVTRPNTTVEKGCIIAEMGDGGIISGNVCSKGRFGIAPAGNNCVVSYNFVSGFGTAGGIRVSQDMAISGNQIYYNVVANSAGFAGITIMDDVSGASANRSNFTIANNVVYNTYYGIAIAQAFSGTIVNNIVWSDINTSPRARLSIPSIIAGETLTCDYNIFQKKGSDAYIVVGGTSYSTLAGWQATGQDAHSTTADPLWVNPAGNNFHLQAGSPAIDTGTSTAYTADLDGNPVPQGSATDIGAYEYGVLYAYEGFAYTSGGDITGATGGSGWASGWATSGSGGGTAIQSSGFTYTGLPVTGNSFLIYDTDGNYQTATRTFSKTFGAYQETYWISFLAKKPSTGREAYINFGGLGLCAYQNYDWKIKTPTVAYTAMTGVGSTTLHLFVIRVDAATSGDTVRVWVDPVISAGEPAASTALVTLTDTTGFTFNTLTLKHGPWGNANQGGQYDEFRLGNSFFSVVTGQ